MQTRAIFFLIATAATMFPCCQAPPPPPIETPLLCYELPLDTVGAFQTIDIMTQFGTEREVRVREIRLLCEPVDKAFKEDDLPETPPDLLPLTGYIIDGVSSLGKTVVLKDQFTTDTFQVKTPTYLWDPVTSKIHTSPRSGRVYPCPLKVYEITGDSLDEPVHLFTRDQFGKQSFQIQDAVFLVEPAVKSAGGTLPAGQKPLKCYRVMGGRSVRALNVQVIDQFLAPWLSIEQPVLFCDPCTKTIVR